jgi:hypothetical protein
VKQSARTVVDESLLSPEGASMKDICSYNEDCLNENCKLYHPHWGGKICIPFAQGKCARGGACKKQHLEWKDMIALSTPDIQYDMFYKTPFKNAKSAAA